jgi:hypothetical protein
MHAWTAIVFVIFLVTGCAPGQLPPIKEAAIAISDTSKCYGLDTNFSFVADRYDDGPSGFQRIYQKNFAHMFDFGVPGKIQSEAKYARVTVNAKDNSMHILFFSESENLIYQVDFDNAKILECENGRTVTVFSNILLRW